MHGSWKAITAAALGLATLAVAGCGGGGNVPGGSDPGGSSEASAPLSSDLQAHGLTVTLTSPSKAYGEGQSVPLTLTIANTTADAVPISIAGNGYDFEVTDGPAVIYRYSTGKDTPADIALGTVPGGGQIAYQAVWNQENQSGAAVPPGTYSVLAWTTNGPLDELGASDISMAAPVTITVQ